ncbi:hypothetical protein EEL32_11560 [Brevibacillus laterosporus]|nr:hypothetical protein [Brevibacillus laterosporus]TPG69293.1 hypothetical protein EEL31_12685 [Brevibacillus laterosporus]TPG86756.1 hypothetical protein EEL32_11560 [Brevibacillus laterosporus]
MKRDSWLNTSVLFYIIGVVIAFVAIGTLIHTIFFYLMSLIFDIRIESIFSVIAFSVSVYLLIIPALLSSFISSVINIKLNVSGTRLRFLETVVSFVFYYISVYSLVAIHSGISISSMGIVAFALMYALLIRYDELYNFLKNKIIS